MITKLTRSFYAVLCWHGPASPEDKQDEKEQTMTSVDQEIDAWLRHAQTINGFVDI